MQYDILLSKIHELIKEKKSDIEIADFLELTDWAKTKSVALGTQSYVRCIRNLIDEVQKTKDPLVGPLSEPPSREANPEFWRVVDSLDEVQCCDVRHLVFKHLDDVGSALCHNTDVSILVQYLLDNHACWDELKQKLGVK